MNFALLLLVLLGACVTGPSVRDYHASLPHPSDSLLSFGLPIEGVSPSLVSLYGWRNNQRVHEGVDFRAPIGTPILAAERGVVMYVGQSLSGYGLIVILDHGGGWTSLYAHLSRSLIRKGNRVQKGQRIAHSGNTGRTTGPHLHFEIRKGADPLDPLLFLPQDRLKYP